MRLPIGWSLHWYLLITVFNSTLSAVCEFTWHVQQHNNTYSNAYNYSSAIEFFSFTDFDTWNQNIEGNKHFHTATSIEFQTYLSLQGLWHMESKCKWQEQKLLVAFYIPSWIIDIYNHTQTVPLQGKIDILVQCNASFVNGRSNISVKTYWTLQHIS